MYDAYIIDDRQADRKHLRNLLVQYQIQNGVEARITGCTFADPLTPQTVTVMYLLDAADGRAQPVIAQVRAGQTQHHIVLTGADLPAAHSGRDRRNAADRAALKAGRRGGAVPAAARSGAAVRPADAGNLCLDSQGPALFHRAGRRFYILKAAAKRRFWSRQRRNRAFRVAGCA